MSEQAFARAVRLACHDLRTPLAAINGLAKMLARQPELDGRQRQFAEMIDAAGVEMASLLDQLWLAARIAEGAYEPRLAEADTLELARSDDPLVSVEGSGATVSIDVEAASAALAALAQAVLRHGELPGVSWNVEGRRLSLAPFPEQARAAVAGAAPRDLGAIVGRMVLEALGGRVTLETGELRVELA